MLHSRGEMAKAVLTVVCEWDGDAGVWSVTESNVPGLSAEAPTVEAMNKLLSELVPELMALNSPADCNVPRELLVNARQKIEVHC
jgi:hypothetical protein